MWKPRSSGEVVDARFEIIQGPTERPDLMGGMGCVYLCHDRESGRPVALKTFRPEFTGHLIRSRLLREATTWVSLGSHPNIVQAYGLCQPDDGSIYLVLQLIAPESPEVGASLRAQAEWHTAPASALLVAAQVACGMRHATSRVPGLVHRDLKPENILVGADGIARVADFGLAQTPVQAEGAKPITGPGHPVTATGMIGTPLYMAPEQWRSDPLDLRADIYALGCILKELICRAAPVSGESIETIAAAHLRGDAAALSSVPRELRGLLRRMVARDANDRCGTWEEVVNAITRDYAALTGKNPPTPDSSESPARDEAEALLAIGYAYLRLGDIGAGADAFNRARQLAESASDMQLTAQTINAQGTVLMETGRGQEAVPLLAWAADWYLRNSRLGAAARVFGTLGQVERRLTHHKEALQWSEAALRILRQLNDRRAVAVELLHMANTHGVLHDYDSALQCHGESALLADALGDEALVGMNVFRMGLVFSLLGMDRESRHCLRHASLLYLRAGREDYAEDVRRAQSEFKRTGSFGDEAFEADMDALFGVPPDPSALLTLVSERPGLLESHVVSSLLSAQARDVGFECTARAMREHGTILAAISQHLSRER